VPIVNNGGQTLEAKAQLADELGTWIEYAPGKARREIPPPAQDSFPATRSGTTWHAGHNRSEVQRGHFCQRVFLARPQGLPPFKIAFHEEKILGGQNPGEQETRRAGAPGSSQAGMDGADGVGMPRWLCRRSEKSTACSLDHE